MTIKKIFVAGAGLMGGGISQVCAQAGYDVTMRDLSEDILTKRRNKIGMAE
jgi:3-hydroxyacyl-CoA dehydrogenase